MRTQQLKMKKKQMYAAAGAAVFCALAVLLFIIWNQNRPATMEGEKTVTVEVVHGDGTEKTFQYQTDEEYLGPLLEAEGLISGTESQYGLFVDTVDGETASYETNGSWWKLSCDGEDAQTGADGVVLTDGGVYTWTYTVG